MKRNAACGADLASTGGAEKTSASNFVRPRDLLIGLWMNLTASVAWGVSLSKSTVEAAQDKVILVISTTKKQILSAAESTRMQGKRLAVSVQGKIDEARALVQARITGASTMLSDVACNLRGRAYRVGEVALGYVPSSVKSTSTAVYSTIVTKYASAVTTLRSIVSGTKETFLGYVQSVRSRVDSTTTAVVAKASAIAAEAQTLVLNYIPTPVKTRSIAAYDYIVATTLATKQRALGKAAAAKESAHAFATAARVKAVEVRTAVSEFAAKPKVQTTAASAVGGAAAFGVAGGAAGLSTGAAIGAAVGVVPALFTFGLSIPIGAVIGGGAGACIGTAVGGTAGFVTGGVVGYKKDEIKSGAGSVLGKASDCAGYVKDTAKSSTDYVKAQAQVVRARIVGGTGGTGA